MFAEYRSAMKQLAVAVGPSTNPVGPLLLHRVAGKVALAYSWAAL